MKRRKNSKVVMCDKCMDVLVRTLVDAEDSSSEHEGCEWENMDDEPEAASERKHTVASPTSDLSQQQEQQKRTA